VSQAPSHPPGSPGPRAAANRVTVLNETGNKETYAAPGASGEVQQADRPAQHRLVRDRGQCRRVGLAEQRAVRYFAAALAFRAEVVTGLAGAPSLASGAASSAGHSDAVALTRSSANFRWLASICSANS